MAKFGLLGNKYWILRHGKSIPNEKGLIVSSLENGVLSEYQLADEGVNQARSAGESFQKGFFLYNHVQVLKKNNIPIENVRICYSPFSRTRHTAQVAVSVLNVSLDGPQCAVLVVSHGDPLQILQTIISAIEKAPGEDFRTRVGAVKVASILSQHRKFALQTGELRQLV
ncbi:hypothetical protein MKX01_002158 [Papaver californicum]|nr:hypothetical protein MKX01_002158 [Papaver californicum]